MLVRLKIEISITFACSYANFHLSLLRNPLYRSLLFRMKIHQPQVWCFMQFRSLFPRYCPSKSFLPCHSADRRFHYFYTSQSINHRSFLQHFPIKRSLFTPGFNRFSFLLWKVELFLWNIITLHFPSAKIKPLSSCWRNYYLFIFIPQQRR